MKRFSEFLANFSFGLFVTVCGGLGYQSFLIAEPMVPKQWWELFMAVYLVTTIFAVVFRAWMAVKRMDAPVWRALLSGYLAAVIANVIATSSWQVPGTPTGALVAILLIFYGVIQPAWRDELNWWWLPPKFRAIMSSASLGGICAVYGGGLGFIFYGVVPHFVAFPAPWGSFYNLAGVIVGVALILAMAMKMGNRVFDAFVAGYTLVMMAVLVCRGEIFDKLPALALGLVVLFVGLLRPVWRGELRWPTPRASTEEEAV